MPLCWPSGGQQVLAYDLGVQHGGRDGNSTPSGKRGPWSARSTGRLRARCSLTPRAAAGEAGQAAGHLSLITGGVSWRSAAMVSPSQPVPVYGGQLVPHDIQRDTRHVTHQHIPPPY